MTGTAAGERLVAQAAAAGIRQIATSAVIVRQGRVLLLLRAVDTFLGGPCHMVPGTLVEPGETLRAALVRTVRQTCGLQVATVGDLLGWADSSSGDGTPVRQLFYAVGVVAGEPVRLSLHIGHQWAPLRGDLDVPGDTRAVLERLR